VRNSNHICAAAFTILLGALPASSLGGPALAQAASRPPLDCLVREGLPGNDPLHIVAPASDAAALKAKGFAAADCGDAAFSRDRQIALRDRMCRIAADEPEGIQLQFERILGERPAVLCGVAEAALGAWDSTGGVQ
jgi:hypothetical protein